MFIGKSLIISLDGTAIAAAKSCRVSVSQNFIQACSPTSGRVMTKIPTSYDWSISVDCLIANSAAPGTLINYLRSGKKFLLSFTDGAGQKFAGYAYVKSCEEAGSIGSLATFSASFESSDALFQYTETKAETFQDGEGVEITSTDTTVTYEFASEQGNTKGVAIRPVKAAKLYIVMDDSYAVYQMSFANVKANLHSQATATLNAALVGCGNRIGKVFSLTANTDYTVLMNDHAIENKLYILTE